MKKYICLLLILGLLLGLLAGCNQPSTEIPPVSDTPEAATQPLEQGPPQTPEDFLDQFNEALKGQNIPLEFSFLAPEEEYDYYVVEADAVYTGTGEEVYSQALELWMVYFEDLTGPLEEI